MKYMEVEAVFGITIPKTSKKNALMLMREALDNIQADLDRSDSIFNSFYEIFNEAKDGVDYGYAFGFNKPKIVPSKTLKGSKGRKKSKSAKK